LYVKVLEKLVEFEGTMSARAATTVAAMRSA
jgi:hypothetical protein